MIWPNYLFICVWEFSTCCPHKRVKMNKYYLKGGTLFHSDNFLKFCFSEQLLEICRPTMNDLSFFFWIASLISQYFLIQCPNSKLLTTEDWNVDHLDKSCLKLWSRNWKTQSLKSGSKINSTLKGQFSSGTL